MILIAGSVGKVRCSTFDSSIRSFFILRSFFGVIVSHTLPATFMSRTIMTMLSADCWNDKFHDRGLVPLDIQPPPIAFELLSFNSAKRSVVPKGGIGEQRRLKK